MPTRYRRDKHEDTDLYMTKDEQKSPARGDEYGREMSQRPAASTSRAISNPQTNPASLPRSMEFLGLREAVSRLNLSGGQEMELMQNGYTDVDNWRYVVDRSSGEVSMAPKPGSPHSEGFYEAQILQNKRHDRQMQYGSPKSMEQEVRAGSKYPLRYGN